MKRIYFWLACCMCLGQCKENSLQELDFIGVSISTAQFVNFNEAAFEGILVNAGNAQNGICGFIWSYDESMVLEQPSSAERITLPLSSASADGRFITTISDIQRNETIYVRAFVEMTIEDVGTRLVYSRETARFSVGEIVTIEGQPVVLNDSVTMAGRLVDLQNQPVEQWGYVLSQNNPAPVMGCADCQNNISVNIDQAGRFEAGFGGLSFNSTYYARAYAISKGDTFYSSAAHVIEIQDGWELIQSFPYGYAEGGVAVVGGKAYAGFGCKKALGCLYNDLLPDFWQFEPEAANGQGQWSAAAPLTPFMQKRYNATLFSGNGQVHALFGEYYENNESNVLLEFNRYDPLNNSWSNLQVGSVIPDGRTGAVAFELGGKVYVGTGRDQDYGALSDFYEYDPASGFMRRVADLPLQLNLQSAVIAAGRYEAIAFSDGVYGYVGCGQYGSAALSDIWRYTPPTPQQDAGKWELVGFMPGTARYQAVAFAIDGKGYIGSGYHPNLGYLKDWWQYNPQTNTWTSVAFFPGVARTNAIGFTLNGSGYFGTGHTKVLINGGLAATEYTLSDFWRYIPAQ